MSISSNKPKTQKITVPAGALSRVWALPGRMSKDESVKGKARNQRWGAGVWYTRYPPSSILHGGKKPWLLSSSSSYEQSAVPRLPSPAAGSAERITGHHTQLDARATELDNLKPLRKKCRPSSGRAAPSGTDCALPGTGSASAWRGEAALLYLLYFYVVAHVRFYLENKS